MEMPEAFKDYCYPVMWEKLPLSLRKQIIDAWNGPPHKIFHYRYGDQPAMCRNEEIPKNLIRMFSRGLRRTRYWPQYKKNGVVGKQLQRQEEAWDKIFEYLAKKNT